MTEEKQVALDDFLQGVTVASEKSMVDVALALLDEKNKVLTTEIRNVGMMNALKLLEDFAERKKYKIVKAF